MPDEQEPDTPHITEWDAELQELGASPHAGLRAELERFTRGIGRKVYYGDTVSQIITIAHALETVSDSVILKALFKDDEAVIPIAIDKLLGTMGRERKLALLKSVLDLCRIPDAEKLWSSIRDLYALRDKLAHGAIVEMDNDGDATILNLAGYRRGRLHMHNITRDEVIAIRDAGNAALSDLIPHAIVGSPDEEVSG